jgi:parvulin-like peptidyl-prolyl isomerase
MISSFRRALENKIARNVIWGVLASIMLLTSLPMLFEQHEKTSHWILSIDKKTYSQKELQHEVESYVKYAQFRYGPFAQLILQQLNMNTLLEIIIQQEVVKSFASKQHIAISEAAIEKQLKQELEARGKQAKVEALTSEGNLNMSVVSQLIAPLTYAQLVSLTGDDMRRQLIMDSAQAAAYVTQDGMKHALVKSLAKRKVSAVSVGIERFLKDAKAQVVTDEQLRAFYLAQNTQTRRYWTVEERSGLLYVFDPALYGIDILDKDIEQYYQSHKQAEFAVEPAQVKVQHILLAVPTEQDRARIKIQAETIAQEAQRDPAAFDGLVEKYSEASAKKDKGVIDFFKRGQKDQAFDVASFALAQDGDVSGVVETAQGYEIIKRLAKKAAVYKPLSEVKDSVKKSLISQRFSRTFEQDIKRASMQENKKDALAALVKNKKAVESTIERTSLNDKLEIKKLFATYKGSFAPYVQDGKGYVVLVKEVSPAVEFKFQEVKQRVQDDYYHDQAVKAQVKYLQGLRAQLSAKKLHLLAQEDHLTEFAMSSISLDDRKALEDMGKKYGSAVAEGYAQLSQVGDVSICVEKEVGYVMQLVGYDEIASDTLKAKRHTAELGALHEQERLLSQSFVAYLVKNAKIKFNESLYR